MKLEITLILFLVIGCFVQAQTHKCGTPEINREFMLSQCAQGIDPLEISVNGTFDENVYIIPVVVHILHLDGPENISDQQVLDAIDNLTVDYNALNEDLVNVVPEFQDVIGNARIEFKLAKLDPYGNPTNGIDRIYSDETLNAWDDFNYINQWAPHKYMNIWTVKDMGDSGVAAYAYYPSTAQDYPEWDGIVTLHDYFGYSGTAGPATVHTLSHEVGHYLNLIHPWGDEDGCGGTDYVADTPPTTSDTTCDPPYDICNPGVIENFQNIMGGNYYCDHMLTIGQVGRMNATLNSLVANRFNLWQTQNLIDTGLLDPMATNEFNDSKITLYPSPASDAFTVQNLKGNEKIEVYNASGKRVMTENNGSSTSKNISVKHLPQGVYFIKVQGDSHQENLKLIKK